MSEPSGDLDITQEVLDSLGSKLDSFGQGLPDEERVVLATVLAAGMQAIGAEVQGFALGELEVDVAPIKRYKLPLAWPKSLEIGSLKAGDTSVP